jgi:hypothetical protein
MRLSAAKIALVLASAAALQAFQAPAPAPAVSEKCTLEGRVVNAATGEPLGKTSIMLTRSEPSRPASGLPQIFGTTTDASGRFAMKDLDPGGYRIKVTRSGFVGTEYGAKKLTGSGTVVTLAPGKALKDIDIRLTPHGVVAGRIVDEDGEPVVSGSVQLLKLQYTNGKKQLQPSAVATTNDLGEYRAFGAAPGKYYISVGFQLADAATGLAVDRSATPRPEVNT